MILSTVLWLAFLIGGVCGLRSMTAPAVVCWGAHFGWLHLDGSKLGFLHHPVSLAVFTLCALGELVGDKVPKIPSRTLPGPLVVRVVFGGLCAAALCISAHEALLAGVFAGILGAIAGAVGGYSLRGWLTLGFGMPDFAIALVEDAVAVGGGMLIVSRF
jgi:uncharacterized membrane protein